MKRFFNPRGSLLAGPHFAHIDGLHLLLHLRWPLVFSLSE